MRSGTIVVAVWPVTRVRVESSLALLVRIEGVSRWIEARTSAEGREVEGDGRRGIAPETPGVPSRAEALGSLVASVCQKLVGALEEWRGARFDSLLDRGLGKLEGAPGEEAVEDLVAFLYARRAEDDSPGFRRAAEALRRIAGLDLAAAWGSRPGLVSDPRR